MTVTIEEINDKKFRKPIKEVLQSESNASLPSTDATSKSIKPSFKKWKDEKDDKHTLKKPFLKKKKNISYLYQSYQRTKSVVKKFPKLRKTLFYILFIKKFQDNLNYKNIKLLKVFLTKYGKIKSRLRTRINIQQQKQISYSIRKARVLGLLPFTYNIKV